MKTPNYTDGKQGWKASPGKLGSFVIKVQRQDYADVIASFGKKEDADLAAAAPELLACVFGLMANFPMLGGTGEVSGADLVDWLSEQAPYWRDALKKAGVK